MNKRSLYFMFIALVTTVFVLAAFPQWNVTAQCYDGDKKIECPTKEPPKDPGNPPAEDNSNNNPNSADIVVTETPTPTQTPKPTETKVPTATSTKPVEAPAASQPDSSGPPPIPDPAPAPFSPWLAGLAGILIGLLVGAFGGPAIFGGSLFPRAPAPSGGGSSFGDDESTRFVKWSRESGGPGEHFKQDAGAVGEHIKEMGADGPPGEHIKEMGSGSDDGSTLFVKLERNSSTPFLTQSTGQVTEVHVRGYEDDTHRKEIVGSATSSGLTGTSPHQKGGEHIKEMGPGGDHASILDSSSHGEILDNSSHGEILDSSSHGEILDSSSHNSILDSSSQTDMGAGEADGPGGEHLKDEGGENIRHVEAEMYEEEIELKYRKDDP